MANEGDSEGQGQMGIGIRSWAAALVIGSSTALISCQKDVSPELAQVRAEQKKSAEATRTVEADLKRLNARIAALEVVSRGLNKGASFDIGSHGYTKVEHNNGLFLISLEDIKPKGDGQQVVFNIGNPMLANFVGMKFKVRWGPRPKAKEGTNKYFEEWFALQDKYREKEFEINDLLRAGAWNRVAVVVAPASAEMTGSIEILDIVTNEVRLSR